MFTLGLSCHSAPFTCSVSLLCFVEHARLGFPGGLDICDILKDPSLGPCPEAHASQNIVFLLSQPITTQNKTIDRYTPGPLKPLFTFRFVTT